jgi:hypothetical protein
MQKQKLTLISHQKPHHWCARHHWSAQMMLHGHLTSNNSNHLQNIHCGLSVPISMLNSWRMQKICGQFSQTHHACTSHVYGKWWCAK